MTAAAFNLHRSGFGRALKAVRENDVATKNISRQICKSDLAP
jgi:ABC-type branched-subunit amino acid transport system permease subunit